MEIRSICASTRDTSRMNSYNNQSRSAHSDSIETIKKFLNEPVKINNEIGFSSFWNMEETSVYLDYPANYTYEVV